MPTIVITAAADAETKVAELHVPEHLPKPLDIGRLLETLRRYCV